MIYLDLSEQQLTLIYNEIKTFLGAYKVNVELSKEEVLTALNRSFLTFQREMSLWQLSNQWGNMYGQVKGTQQISQLATINFGLVQQVSDWFASMGRYGGKIPWHKDYITLESGRQIYNLSVESSKPYIPGTRRIHKIMWVANNNIMSMGRYSPKNPNGDDVTNSNAWSLNNAGLAFGNNRLGLMASSSDVIMLMQARENLNEVLFSEFFYNLSGDMLEVTPMPTNLRTNSFDGMRVFYYYWDEKELNIANANIDKELHPEMFDSSTGMLKGEYNLIANPLDVKFNALNWSDLSPWAESFIFEYTLALCKYIIGSKWRVVRKTMSEGEMNYEIEFDYQSLLSESEQEKNSVIESLRSVLEGMKLGDIYEEKLRIFDAAKKINNGGSPKRWQAM